MKNDLIYMHLGKYPLTPTGKENEYECATRKRKMRKL